MVLAMVLLAACGGGGSKGDSLVQPDLTGEDVGGDGAVVPDVPGDQAARELEAVDGASDLVHADGGAADAAMDLPDFAAPDVAPEEWAKQYGTACEGAERVGLFEVAWSPNKDKGTAGVNGSVTDAVEAKLILEKAGEEGPCVLLKRVVPFCEQDCKAEGMRCAKGGICAPWTKPLSVGTVVVNGLVKPVIMELTGATYFDTSFDGMAWELGGNIELIASGGQVEAFSLQGAGVAPLAIPAADWTLSKGASLTFQWEPSGGPGQVQVEINLMQHASNSHDLVCVLEDTGQFTIPQTLTDGLINLGVFGAPKVIIFRRTVDSVQVSSGCIEFQVKAKGTASLTLK